MNLMQFHVDTTHGVKTNWSEEPVDSQRQKPQKPAIFGAIFNPGCESGANLPNPHPAAPRGTKQIEIEISWM